LEAKVLLRKSMSHFEKTLWTCSGAKQRKQRKTKKKKNKKKQSRGPAAEQSRGNRTACGTTSPSISAKKKW